MDETETKMKKENLEHGAKCNFQKNERSMFLPRLAQPWLPLLSLYFLWPLVGLWTVRKLQNLICLLFPMLCFRVSPSLLLDSFLLVCDCFRVYGGGWVTLFSGGGRRECVG